MTDDELEEAEANLEILIGEELLVHHLIEGHSPPIEACPVCRSHVCGASPVRR